jgi:hypothetical protein
MGFIRKNRDSIIASIVAALIWAGLSGAIALVSKWVVPSAVDIWLQQNVNASILWVASNVVLLAAIVVLVVRFWGTHYVIAVRKSRYKRVFDVVENNYTVNSRKELEVVSKRRCIPLEDMKTFPLWFTWTGDESRLIANKDDCIAVKDPLQVDSLQQRWHLEYRSTKKAKKPFDVEYTVIGTGEFSPVCGIYVDYPINKLIIRVKFNPKDEALRVKYLCRTCSISNMGIDESELEPDKYEYVYEVKKPKLFHTYRIEWVYRDPSF